MKQKHWLQIAVMSLFIVIATVLGVNYYNEYIAPESFTIGNIAEVDYTSLQIKDYLSSEDVIFSQNINDVSFSNKDGTALYEYNFEHKTFDGVKNSYIIYVNDYMINNLTSNAGTISGTYKINYYDVELNKLCSSDITIAFSFTNLSSRLRVILPTEDLGYLINHFQTNNFIITLAKNPYSMQDKNENSQETNNLIEVTFCDESTVLTSYLVEKNSNLNSVNAVIPTPLNNRTNYSFVGYCYADTDIPVDLEKPVTESTIIKARYAHILSGIYAFNGLTITVSTLQNNAVSVQLGDGIIEYLNSCLPYAVESDEFSSSYNYADAYSSAGGPNGKILKCISLTSVVSEAGELMFFGFNEENQQFYFAYYGADNIEFTTSEIQMCATANPGMNYVYSYCYFNLTHALDQGIE